MVKKETIAMILAGGRGSRLGILTAKMAKPAVPFGGKYRIIDFPLSNCVNSGIDTVGILTQYQPYRLHNHIGIGIPWDLDRSRGGVSILPPYEAKGHSNWYSGTANAIFQNIPYIEQYDPEFVLILSGDHIYKMDYEAMLEYHKAKNADVTIACMTVPWEEASRFGTLIVDQSKRVLDFEEKPKKPRSNLASMGIYIFSRRVLVDALLDLQDIPQCDFGKHVLPYLKEQNASMAAYLFDGYWKDVGTLESYWKANMELVDLIPEFNLYEKYWKVYTNTDHMDPLFVKEGSFVERSLISSKSFVKGTVVGSVIGAGVRIGENAIVRDSIIMHGARICDNVVIDKAIIAEDCTIGEGTVIGCGQEAPSQANPAVYNSGLVTIGEGSVIPPGVRIGKNTVISGLTTVDDYPGGELPSGGYILKAGDLE